MDTSQIKKFAVAARRVLLNGVVNKISTLGFNAQGQVTLAQMPVLAHNDTNFNGRIIPGTNFYHQWHALHQAIQQKGVKNVYEEVAYTWFNRLVAIRILQNQETQLITNVLDFVDDSNTPSIVNNARHGILPAGMDENTTNELNRLLRDDTKTTEQFAVLISAFCEATPILHKVFGRIDDYTELLLPNDILANNGFVDMLNNTEYITPDDYKQTELIGWLYQFYISERKDEVFDLGEWSAEDIPAGTQIFTPNWIVKYMVENTLGRIYLDNNPDSGLADEMKYLVEQGEGEHPVFNFENMEDLRCADFSCGSGHILGEFFDMLYHIYTNERWYGSRDAIENIFKHNIAGIDLDTRATQLSTFALLLKACQKDESFIDAEVMPNVLDMPSVTFDGVMPIVDNLFRRYNPTVKREISDAFKLMEKANELGSIMKFDLSDTSREALASVVSVYRIQGDANAEIVKSIDLMLMLTEKYSAVCMNPPYMGSKHMNKVLKNYVNKNYKKSKEDLYAVFMEVAIEGLAANAKYGMINMQSWMFLSSFENLRKTIIERRAILDTKGKETGEYTPWQHIDSLLHLGPRTFDELSGEVVQNVTFVITKSQSLFDGTFYRLVNGNSCNAKRILFHKGKDKYTVNQKQFEQIPGSPIAYWVSEKLKDIFINVPLMSSLSRARLGQNTGDNERFLRYWQEINYKKIGREISSFNDTLDCKWIPYTKGGITRKWYSTQETVINWLNDGEEVKAYCVIRNKGKHWSRYIQSLDCFFKKGIVFPRISSDLFYTRFVPKGSIFDVNAPACFNEALLEYQLGFLNSKVNKIILEILCPTLTFQVGDVAKVPFLIDNKRKSSIDTIVKQNVTISKSDWDAHETSWDFEENELVRIFKQNGGTLEETLDTFIEEWTAKFHELHDNEEELNRQFIETYGLQDELTPDVPLNEITILQQKEVTVENGQLQWDKSVVLKQLLSYATGCWMGRYRLDRPGLHIAHPNPTDEELASYTAFGKPFEIDDDGIIPLMGEDSPFPDNAVSRMKDFIGQVFGEENKATNIHFIEATLGRNMTLEKFFMKEFWKDHTARYQKRPIYWLFQSARRNPAFQVLVYMHRMDAYTCEKVRTYLLSYIEYLKNRIAYLETESATPAVTRELNAKREALRECTEYELRLHDVANQQIAFDLDDGVKVNYAKFGDVLAAI